MERSWADDALALMDAYPWKTAAQRAKAEEEAELVAFGEYVEPGDLPLAVRRWAAKRGTASAKAAGAAGYVWRGESLKEAVAGLERLILAQALEKCGGNAVRAAQALSVTPRIVRYKARKYGLKQKKQERQKHGRV